MKTPVKFIHDDFNSTHLLTHIPRVGELIMLPSPVEVFTKVQQVVHSVEHDVVIVRLVSTDITTV